jgi:hypothetical protein
MKMNVDLLKRDPTKWGVMQVPELTLTKVEGATNTPPKTNIYKRLPIANTLLPCTVSRDVGVSRLTE